MNDKELHEEVKLDVRLVYKALRRKYPDTKVSAKDIEDIAHAMIDNRGREKKLPHARLEIFPWLFNLADGLHLRIVQEAIPNFRSLVQGQVDQVYSEVNREVSAIARRYRVNEEDLKHDAYRKAIEYINKTKELEHLPVTPDHAKRWFLRIVRNLAVDQWRAETRRRQVPLTDEASAPEAINDPEELEALRGCLHRLPPEEREVIELNLQGFTPAEIAEELGLPIKEVYYRIRRAKVHLAICLKKHAEWEVGIDECTVA